DTRENDRRNNLRRARCACSLPRGGQRPSVLFRQQARSACRSDVRANIARVSSVWRVEPLLEGTSYSSSCTLVTNSSHRVVIDTGLSIQERSLLDALRARGLDPADVDLVVNTHLHVD